MLGIRKKGNTRRVPRGVPRQGSAWGGTASQGPILYTKITQGSSGCALSCSHALLIKRQAVFSGFSKHSSSASYANFMYIYLNKLGQPYQLKKSAASRSYLPHLGRSRRGDPEPKPHRRLDVPGKHSSYCPPTRPGTYRTLNFQPPHRTLTTLSPSVCISKLSLAFPQSPLVQLLFHRSDYDIAPRIPASQSHCQAHPGGGRCKAPVCL